MIYFASDFHLGIDTGKSSEERERLIVQWMDEIKKDAKEVWFLGDMFDFWFEYKTVVPKGFTRFIGKLGELVDSNIKIFFFTGNHDMWMFDYFTDEFGIPIYRAPIECTIGNKRFYIGHGDGLGPGDHGYKFIKKVFASRLCQRLFAILHPTIGFWIAKYWSRKSRESNREASTFLGSDKEWLVQYVESKSRQIDVDYFIFGHRHIPIDYTLNDGKTRYINLGDWMRHFSYAVFDGEDIQLRFYENPNGVVFPVEN